MEHGDKKRMNKMYGNRVKAASGIYMEKRMKKNKGGVANAQPMYSEPMPKAKAN